MKPELIIEVAHGPTPATLLIPGPYKVSQQAQCYAHVISVISRKQALNVCFLCAMSELAVFDENVTVK